MSLQRRLTLFFVAIVILPLAIAAFMVQRVVVGEVNRRAEISLAPALDSITVLYNDRSEGIDERVHAAVDRTAIREALDTGSRLEIDTLLQLRLDATQGIDFMLLLDEDGAVRGFARNRARFVPGVETPGIGEIRSSPCCLGDGFVRTPQIDLHVAGEGIQGHVIGGFWLDRDLLVGAPQDVHLSIASGNQIIASTAQLSSPAAIEPVYQDSFEIDVDGDATAKAKNLGASVALVASTPTAPISSLSKQVQLTMLALLFVALGGTSVLAYFLARGITQPLEELSEGARAISEGRLDHEIKVHSRDEVGQLATVFNDMTEQLRSTINQLSFSRDQLQRTVRSVGETLRSTNDMNQMLQSILNTAAEAVEADAAILWMFTSTREELYPAFAKGVDTTQLARVHVGQGIVGLVAERATRVMLPGGSGSPHPTRTEPDFPVAIAIPMYSQDRLHAVLATYRQDVSRPFSASDLDTVLFLAEQGGVAIENVSLHEEAQRLSLTDGLTGVWNRRFFQMQFRQVLATATRFNRPFSILMMDLDNFKQINDTYGHQRGDEILVEFSQRVNRVLREVDTFARYGGEEFICLLSETDEPGAMTTAEKVLDAIRAEPFGSMGDHMVSMTVSVGVASYPAHGDSFRSLVESADRALYKAKQSGKDRAVPAPFDEPPSALKLVT